MFNWRLWTTTKTNRRVNVPFESLSINREDALSEARARYGTSDVHVIPENRPNVVTPFVTSIISSETGWIILGTLSITLFYHLWAVIVPFLLWWGFKVWIGVN